MAFLILSYYSTRGNTTEASGLLFKTNDELIENRTSLDLYNGNFQKMTDSFSIQFDISIWNTKAFGYIFRLVNKKQEEISLVFVTQNGEDNLYFNFNSDITNSSIHVPTPMKILKNRNWFSILIHFDLTKDEAIISMQDKSYTCTHIGLHNPDALKLIFGLYGTNLDVASMALKNIVITKNNNKPELFPLSESQGNTVYNNKGVARGYVKNPVWLVNKHHEWDKVAEFTADLFAGIAFNSNAGKILSISSDSISAFDLNNHQLDTIKTVRLPFKTVSGNANAIFDSIMNCCYVYALDDTLSHRLSFAAIGFNSQPPAVSSGYATIDNRLHHHNVFLSENGKELYIFGGYGKFTYSNTFYRYNQTQDRWDSLAFSGDTIYPRFFAAAGKGINPNEILIYGGYGNQSGKQELGGKNLYDLYQIDLTGKTIKKLWEQKITGEAFVPCDNLILDPDKTHFYTLCYPHHIVKTELKLYKFNIKDGSYEIVGNAIPVKSEKIETEVFLFFNESLQEFIAVAREYADPEKSNVRIYSLYSPPVSLTQLNNSRDMQKKSGYRLVIFIPLLLVIAFIFFIFLIRKNKKAREVSLDEVPEDIQIQEEKQLLKKSNALYVLGNFTAFDKNGKDITYRFSAKIQALIADILLSQNDENGITTQKLTADLWPDKELKDAKNIRGVTVNHLRNILEDIQGIRLVCNNSKWWFAIDDDFYCDYLHTLKIMAEIQESKAPESLFQQLARLVKRGSLFRSTETEWIDDYKQKYETQVEQLLIHQLQADYNRENFQNALNLSDALFVIDPLNEEVLTITIRILKKTGKIEQSQNLYNRFSLRHKTIMGENYSVKYAFI